MLGMLKGGHYADFFYFSVVRQICFLKLSKMIPKMVLDLLLDVFEVLPHQATRNFNHVPRLDQVLWMRILSVIDPRSRETKPRASAQERRCKDGTPEVSEIFAHCRIAS